MKQSTRLCSIDSCGRRHQARGWCNMHYMRWLTRGDVEDRKYRTTCVEGGCDRPFFGLERCSLHYGRLKASTAMKCAIDGCQKLTKARGWCAMHYARWQRRGDTGDYAPEVTPRAPKELLEGVGHSHCIVGDCKRPRRSTWGLCRLHSERKRTGRDILAPVVVPADPNNPDTWGRTTTADGYLRLQTYVGGVGQYIFEHRWVMQQELGRPLFDDENVHHINGDRADNRLENLELWSSAQPKGQRVEDKVRFAFEILTRYQPASLAAPCQGE